MSHYARGFDLLNALCDALGITDQNVTRITIDADVGDAARVTIRTLVPDAKTGDLVHAFADYTLTPAALPDAQEEDRQTEDGQTEDHDPEADRTEDATPEAGQTKAGRGEA